MKLFKTKYRVIAMNHVHGKKVQYRLWWLPFIWFNCFEQTFTVITEDDIKNVINSHKWKSKKIKYYKIIGNDVIKL